MEHPSPTPYKIRLARHMKVAPNQNGLARAGAILRCPPGHRVRIAAVKRPSMRLTTGAAVGQTELEGVGDHVEYERERAFDVA